jgi:hypothetical protein
MSSYTCDRSDSVVVGFVDSDLGDLGAGVAISCFALCSIVIASVTRQRSSVTSRLFVRLEVDNIRSILSVIEGPWCSWGMELGRGPGHVSGALGAPCGLACNITS